MRNSSIDPGMNEKKWKDDSTTVGLKFHYSNYKKSVGPEKNETNSIKQAVCRSCKTLGIQ